ncbi:MAG TPA: glycosyltransferase family 2 protein [Planctomycetota bacterium]|nr:glycosyltransferase family 2 protein [Planctomycetota bacterium]
MSCQLSIVVPIYNEVESLRELHRELREVLDGSGQSHELIFVDDGSHDGSRALLLQLRRSDPTIRVLCFRRNFGQTAALAAGFDQARGEVVVTLDGDLQNDPADIPALLAAIEEGHDIVAGWRRERRDTLIRRLPSLVANRLISFVTGVRIHDTGCTLKALRRELVRNLPIYAEQHRFLPAMSAGSGARVCELVVNHRPRRFGVSKYGISRAMRVALDLVVVKMIASFSRRPIQFFGWFLLPVLAMIGLSLVSSWFTYGTPLPGDALGLAALISIMMLFMVCVYFLLLGLLAELIVKAFAPHRPGRGGAPLQQEVVR